MRLLKKLLLGLLLSLYFMSCASLKGLKLPENQRSLSPNNLALLEGTYINRSNTILPNEQIGLWNHLDNKPPKYYHNRKEMLVALKVLSPRKLQISLILAGDTLQQKVIKGQIKAGAFVARRRFLLLPLIPILFWYTNSQVKLSIVEDKLMIASAWSFFTFAWVGGQDGKGRVIAEFRRLEP